MATDLATLRSRRAVLVGAVGGFAAVAAHAFGQPVPARASDPNDVVLGAINAAGSETAIKVNDSELDAVDALSGETVFGSGMRGRSKYGRGVEGISENGFGITGVGGDTGAFGVGAVGVYGESWTDYGAGLRSYAHGHGGTGIIAIGESRGARFEGGKAQIRLEPNTSPHPASGQAGNMYVDGHHRLWFCKGGTAWVKLA